MRATIRQLHHDPDRCVRPSQNSGNSAAGSLPNIAHAEAFQPKDPHQQGRERRPPTEVPPWPRSRAVGADRPRRHQDRGGTLSRPSKTKKTRRPMDRITVGRGHIAKISDNRGHQLAGNVWPLDRFAPSKCCNWLAAIRIARGRVNPDITGCGQKTCPIKPRREQAHQQHHFWQTGYQRQAKGRRSETLRCLFRQRTLPLGLSPRAQSPAAGPDCKDCATCPNSDTFKATKRAGLPP